MLIAVAILVGVLLACVCGAEWSTLADLRLRAAPIAFAALAIQFLIFTPASPPLADRAEVSLHVASYFLLLVFLVVNIRLPGLWLPALGFALNLLVIAANGGRMPVSPEAWRLAGGAAPVSAGTSYHNVFLANSNSHLRWFGDVLPIPVQPFVNVLSIGDLLLVIGITSFVYRASRARTDSEHGG